MRALPALSLALGLTFAAAAASAQGPRPSPPAAAPAAKPMLSPEMQRAREDMRRTCKPDMLRLCPRGTGDKDARRACMKSHRRDVSPACAQAQSRFRDMRRAQRRG